MTKMYGSITGADLMQMVHEAESDIAKNPNAAEKFVMLSKGTLVAVVNDLKDCLNRKFFFELGRSLQLDESRGQAISNVPERYLADFNDGLFERDKIKNLESARCNSCHYKVTAVETMRGKVYIASEQNKG